MEVFPSAVQDCPDLVNLNQVGFRAGCRRHWLARFASCRGDSAMSQILPRRTPIFRIRDPSRLSLRGATPAPPPFLRAAAEHAERSYVAYHEISRLLCG